MEVVSEILVTFKTQFTRNPKLAVHSGAFDLLGIHEIMINFASQYSWDAGVRLEPSNLRKCHTRRQNRSL